MTGARADGGGGGIVSVSFDGAAGDKDVGNISA